MSDDGSGSAKEEMQGGSSSEPKDDNICRDFLRNVCFRGDRCKYGHPAGEEGGPPPQDMREGTKLQDKMEFCHDFQNGRCHRTTCRFIHCNSEVEREFLSSGYLPPSVKDQVIRKGVAVDFPAVNGGIPICKDFLKGKCSREIRCRFRHVNAMEYDMEMDSYQVQSRQRALPYGGYGHYEEEDMMYERRGGGPPKRRCLTDMEGPPDMGGPYSHAYQMVHVNMNGQEDNHHLLSKIAELEKRVSDLSATNEFLLDQELMSKIGELEKRVSDLTATNEFLLDQNAQLRMGGKTAATGPPAVSMGHSQTGFMLQ